MLLPVSFIMVIGVSGYFYFLSRTMDTAKKSSLSKCIPMILGMTSSLSIGLIIGVWIPKQLAIATILAILISAILAILIGLNFGTNGLIESQASALMGAMMGAMLGVMLSPGETTIMILAMDIIFLISYFSMMLLATRKQANNLFKNKPVSFYLIFIVSFSLISSFGILELNKPLQGEIVQHQHHHHE